LKSLNASKNVFVAGKQACSLSRMQYRVARSSQERWHLQRSHANPVQQHETRLAQEAYDYKV
jgi:hypothetical protein